MTPHRVWWLLLLTACSGELVGGFPTSDAPVDPTRPANPSNPTNPSNPPTPTTPTEPLPPIFECSAAADPSPTIVLRLTKHQYRATLTDLLARGLPANTVTTFLGQGEVARALAAIPDDGSADKARVTYDTQDQRISTLLVEPQLDVATGVATWLSADSNRLATFVRAFAGGTACSSVTSSGCVDAFIASFGERALRRPLDLADGDAAFYRGAYDDATYGGYRGLIAAFLLAPGFLFRTELKGTLENGRDDLVRLTPFELASRLSFTLTGSMPDDALFAAARANFTGSGNTLAEQADRLLSQPRAREHFEGFYRQWLRLNRVPGFNPSATSALAVQDPDRLGAPLPASLDLSQFRLDAFDEQVAMMTHYTFDAPAGSMRDALTSTRSFARSADVASVYGVAAWNGEASQVVSLPPGQRAGLFTRAAFLLSGYPDTNPIHRGARLQVEYLCGVMEPPANVSTPEQYQPPAVPTVRNLVAAKTQIPGTACAGCHTHIVNPLGFALEQYDAFGRNRRQEPIHDASGAIVRWEPVDFAATSFISREADTTTHDALELSAALASSDRFHACYARNVFRSFTGRDEATTDGCVLSALQNASATGSLKDVGRALTQAREFSLRHFTPAL